MNDEPTARIWVNAIIDEARVSKVKEIKGLARTLRQWLEPIVAWHTIGDLGQIDIYNATGSSHVIVDLVGWVQ